MAEKDDKETKTHEHPQPLDLKTGERLATTGRAVAQGVAHEVRGEHETQKGERHTVSMTEVGRIIADWPAPQKNIAQQMIEK